MEAWQLYHQTQPSNHLPSPAVPPAGKCKVVDRSVTKIQLHFAAFLEESYTAEMFKTAKGTIVSPLLCECVYSQLSKQLSLGLPLGQPLGPTTLRTLPFCNLLFFLKGYPPYCFSFKISFLQKWKGQKKRGGIPWSDLSPSEH